MAPEMNIISFIAPLFIITGSALRLAKFNLMPSMKYFTGLPTPANAFFYTGLFLGVHYDNGIIKSLYSHQSVYLLTAIFMSLLLISGIKMFSLKGLEKDFSKNKFQFILLISFVGLLLFNIQLAIPIGVCFYVLLSVVYTFALQQ